MFDGKSPDVRHVLRIIQAEGVAWKQAVILHADLNILPVDVEVEGWVYGE